MLKLLHPSVPDSKVALVCGERGEVWTYGMLRARVDAMAAQLAAPTKRLVFSFCRNDLGSLTGYLGALGAGHAVALLDPALHENFRSQLIRTYEPDFVLAPSDVVWTPGSGDAFISEDSPSGMHCWRRNGPDRIAPHPDLAVLMSTSGSTGSPKFVRLSTWNVEENAASIAEALSVDSGERAITALPFFYSYGLSVVNSHLISGGSLVVTDESILGRGFWDVFRTYGCTSFAGVPYTYEILRRIGFDRFELPTLKTMTQAGGRLAEQLKSVYHRLMSERGGRFIVMYGQTEATARIAVLPHDELPSRPASAGRAVPGGRISIVLPTGDAAAAGEKGEVVYDGPNVMMGYAQSREDLAEGDVLGGRLSTGDLGYLDEEGFLFITGRAKRFVKLVGVRVSLDEVESVVRGLGTVAAVGDDQKVVVYCESGTLEQLADFRLELARMLKLHHSVFDLRRVDALPRTPNGKIDYMKLEVQR